MILSKVLITAEIFGYRIKNNIWILENDLNKIENQYKSYGYSNIIIKLLDEKEVNVLR